MDFVTNKHLSHLSVKELKKYCRTNKITGYSNLRKKDIIELILNNLNRSNPVKEKQITKKTAKEALLENMAIQNKETYEKNTFQFNCFICELESDDNYEYESISSNCSDTTV